MPQGTKKRIDLRGMTCSTNTINVKMALEGLESGERLEILLDEGAAMLDVSRNLKEEGHKIVNVEAMGKAFRVLVEKGAGTAN